MPPFTMVRKKRADGAIHTTAANRELIFHTFAALTRFERQLAQERARAGLEPARAPGRFGSLKPLSSDVLREVVPIALDPVDRSLAACLVDARGPAAAEKENPLRRSRCVISLFQPQIGHRRWKQWPTTTTINVMKLRYSVNQGECFREGVNCPNSIQVLEVDPTEVPKEERDLIADRLRGINVCKLAVVGTGTEARVAPLMDSDNDPVLLEARLPGDFKYLVEAARLNDQEAKLALDKARAPGAY